MKKFSIIISLLLLSTVVIAQLPQLTKKEAKKGWQLLFDGKTFDGWKKANGQAFNGKGWKIENGVLSVDPSQGRGGDIVTDKEFTNFELSLQFKLEKGTNSGIKYFLFKNSSLGCEYQIIDDANHADAKLGKNGNRRLAALYDVYPPAENKMVKDYDWNELKIIARGNHVEHWLNGKKVLTFEIGSPDFQQHVQESKFKNNKGWAETRPSPILLQEHEDIIHFRNIKIRNLK